MNMKFPANSFPVLYVTSACDFAKLRHLNMWPILLTENVLFLLLLGKMLCPSKHCAIQVP